MKRILLTLGFASVFAASAFAQMAAPSASAAPMATPQTVAPVKNPVLTVLRTVLPTRQKNTLAAIDAMPADKFAYKPTPDQMTFAHLVIHIAESNNGLCSKIADVPVPKVDELKETDPKDKLLAAARASFDFCTASLANVDDSKLGDNVDFGRVQGPRAMGVFFLVGGLADHYGAAAMYLRLNGILPPSAQPKK
ncbi:MAG TPA: DinB family protein [Candidatus Limnocylindrales bacterium]|nr:DinB family protein [Candidatus Limnocylindrales bacterium]